MIAQRVAIVTGGGSGIGAATANALAVRGNRVFVTDINEDAAEKVAAQIVALGGQATGAALDVASQETISAFVLPAAASAGWRLRWRRHVRAAMCGCWNAQRRSAKSVDRKSVV